MEKPKVGEIWLVRQDENYAVVEIHDYSKGHFGKLDPHYETLALAMHPKCLDEELIKYFEIDSDHYPFYAIPINKIGKKYKFIELLENRGH